MCFGCIFFYFFFVSYLFFIFYFSFLWVCVLVGGGGGAVWTEVSLYFSPKKWKKLLWIVDLYLIFLRLYNTGFPIREYTEDPGMWCLHASSAHTQGVWKAVTKCKGMHSPPQKDTKNWLELNTGHVIPRRHLVTHVCMREPKQLPSSVLILTSLVGHNIFSLCLLLFKTHPPQVNHTKVT